MPRKAKRLPPLKDPESARPKPPSSTRRGYDHVHRAMRLEVLNTFPLCLHRGEHCTGWSTDAHHLTYPARSLSDYLAVCRPCHRELERLKR